MVKKASLDDLNSFLGEPSKAAAVSEGAKEVSGQSNPLNAVESGLQQVNNGSNTIERILGHISQISENVRPLLEQNKGVSAPNPNESKLMQKKRSQQVNGKMDYMALLESQESVPEHRVEPEIRKPVPPENNNPNHKKTALLVNKFWLNLLSNQIQVDKQKDEKTTVQTFYNQLLAEQDLLNEQLDKVLRENTF